MRELSIQQGEGTMRNLALSVIVVIGIAVGVSRTAEAGPYGAAGCGLGSIVFGNQPGIIQVLAATTNGTFGNQTFGITFGTSNCASTDGGAASATAYVEANRQQLAKEISRGAGETIAGLASVAGCQDEKRVGLALQSQYKAIFPAAALTDQQVGSNVITVLKSDRSLSCSKLN
jgi:hypothetical protein